jgi:hypothetical protein
VLKFSHQNIKLDIIEENSDISKELNIFRKEHESLKMSGGLGREPESLAARHKDQA